MSSDSNVPSIFSIGVGVIAIIFTAVGVGWAVHASNVAEKATLGAADVEVDRRNFEHSQAYREGLRRDCEELIYSYRKAKAAKDDESAKAVLSLLRHRVAGAPPEAVPSDVKQFIDQNSY